MDFGKLFPQGNFKADCWVKVYETTLTEAATSLTISGLHGDTDKEYMLETRIINDYNGACEYKLRPNNDTGSNYGFQYFNATGATVSAGRSTSDKIEDVGYCTALNEITCCKMLISAISGYVRTFLNNTLFRISGETITTIRYMGQSWNNTADEITSLVILATQANGLGIGTHIVLWAKKFKS